MTEPPERPQSADPEPRPPDPHAPASVNATLRLGNGLPAHDRQHIVDRLRRLDDFLQGYPTEKVDLTLSRSGSHSPESALTLECAIAGYPALTAHARDDDLDRALDTLRDEMDRMLRIRKNRREDLEHPRGRR